MTKNTISITLESAINSIAKNKESNHVAVAGRSVFKILQINDEESKFIEQLNMRVGKNLNLNSSCNDVVWSHLDSNLLATGATNGAVVTWNLSKSSRNKMDIVYQDHKRTVNKVCFHPNESNLLLSGSQDGTMKLFDLRQKSDSVSTFLSQSESVRDVQFSKFRDNIFSSVQENGNVQIWNLKKPDHYEKQFTAHSGPVFSCDFHPEKSSFLATAGRDKTIKIWDIQYVKPQLEHCINAIASVARIKWRPQQTTHIASSSLVVDFSIHIWDYRRPFVSFAILQEHKDVTTDFVWRDVNANVLISAGKDGTVYQHTIDEAEHPWLEANPCALDLNNSGDIFLSMSNYLIKDISPSDIINNINKESNNINNKDQNEKQNDKNLKSLNFSLSNRDHLDREHSQISNHQHSSSLTTSSPAVTLVRRGMQIFQHNQSVSQISQPQQNQQTHFISPEINFSKTFTSSAVLFKNKNVCDALSLDWFVETALNYQLTGKPLGDLFDHNAKVAEKLNRIQVAQTWRILKQLYVGSTCQQQSSLQFNQSSSQLMNSTFIDKQTSLDKTGNEMKQRNNSGQQSRHTSGTNIANQQNLNTNTASSNLNENSTSFTSRPTTTQFTTRSRLATFSGNSNRLPLSNTTSMPLSLTQSNKNLSATIKDDSDADESDDMMDQIQETPQDKEFSREHQNFFFGDGDVNDTHGLTSYDVVTNDILAELDDTQLNPNEVQREAFQLKHEIQDYTIPPDLDLINNDLNAMNLVEETEAFEDEYTNSNTNQQSASSKKIIKDYNVEHLLAIEIEANPPFKFTDVVVDMLKFYANNDDIQSTVSILIILGEKLKYAIDLATQENWFYSYIDLLSRFQLWNVINQISNLSVLPSINSLTTISTTIYTSCANCNRSIKNKVAWLCERCKKITSNCSVCHEVVKGIYVWCKICSHGGHMLHLAQWFKTNKQCPSACGHLCEYN